MNTRFFYAEKESLKMQKPTMPLDAAKYDIRVTWHGIKEDNVSADAALVEGFPLDPPDEIGAWYLVQFERDTRIEEKQIVDRYCCIWAREKTAPKKQRAKPVNGEKAAPKKRGGRKPKQFNPQEVVFASDVPKAYKLMLCPHTARMFHDTINNQGREVTKEDTELHTARCHDCSKRDEEKAASAEA